MEDMESFLITEGSFVNSLMTMFVSTATLPLIWIYPLKLVVDQRHNLVGLGGRHCTGKLRERFFNLPFDFDSDIDAGVFFYAFQGVEGTQDSVLINGLYALCHNHPPSWIN